MLLPPPKGSGFPQPNRIYERIVSGKGQPKLSNKWLSFERKQKQKTRTKNNSSNDYIEHCWNEIQGKRDYNTSNHVHHNSLPIRRETKTVFSKAINEIFSLVWLVIKIFLIFFGIFFLLESGLLAVIFSSK